MNQPNLSGIERAVSAAGSQAALASMLKSYVPGKPSVSQQAVSHWCNQGHVPLDRARAISEITGVPVIDLVSAKLRGMFADAA